LISDKLVLTADSKKVKLRRNPEATPDVIEHRYPCEVREVASSLQSILSLLENEDDG